MDDTTDTPSPIDTPAAAACPICFCTLDTAPSAGDDPLAYFDFGIPDRSLACPSSLNYETPHFVCINCIHRIKLFDYADTSGTRLRWPCPICRKSVPVRPFDRLVLREGKWSAACAAAANAAGIEFKGTALKLVTTAEELAKQVEAAASDKPASFWSLPSPIRPPQSPPVPRPVLPLPRPRQATNVRRQPPLQPRPPPVTRQRPSDVDGGLWRWEELLYLSEEEQRRFALTWRNERQMYNQLEIYAARRRAREQRTRMQRVQEQLMQTLS